MKSNCCLSTLITRSSDEGTSYYECKACGEPCDVAPQNQPPLDTGHHAEYDYKKNQTKGEVCGCEADEQGIEHTTDAHNSSKPVEKWVFGGAGYIDQNGAHPLKPQEQEIALYEEKYCFECVGYTKFELKGQIWKCIVEHEKKIREAEEEFEKRTRFNIGMLRQWLNEDKIKDAKSFVTNQDISDWIFNDSYEILSQLKGEKK